jgi:hypothetical protein
MPLTDVTKQRILDFLRGQPSILNHRKMEEIELLSRVHDVRDHRA